MCSTFTSAESLKTRLHTTVNRVLDGQYGSYSLATRHAGLVDPIDDVNQCPVQEITQKILLARRKLIP